MRWLWKLIASALAFAACIGAHGQLSADVLSHLESAKRLALLVRVKATIRTSSFDNIGGGLYTWAHATNEEHFKSLPGSRIAPGYETVWNGTRAMYRPPDNPWAAPTSHFPIEVSETRQFNNVNPISQGYTVSIAGSNAIGTWVIDALSGPGVSARETGDGHIEMNLSTTGADGGRRTIELDPQRGYMIDRIQEVILSAPGPDAKRSALSTRDTRVVEARQIGGCWLPTKSSTRYVRLPGRRGSYTIDGKSEAVDITTNVPDSEFAMFERPGDTISDGTTNYVVDAKGKWIPVSRPNPGSTTSRTIVLLAVAAGFIGSFEVVMLIRRGRRRAQDYWGRPGVDPNGPKP